MKFLKRPPASRRANPTDSKLPLTYYRSGKPETSSKSPFQKNIKKRGALRKFLVATVDILFVVIVLLTFLYSLIVSPQPKVYADSLIYRPLSAYQNAAAKQLQALKNRNKLSLDEQGIVKAMQAQFPEITSAAVELPLLGQTPIIHLYIAGPSFILRSQTADYVVDSVGTAIARSADLPSIKKLPLVTDQTGFDIRTGKQVMDAGSTSFIKALVEQCQHAQVPIASLTLPPRAQEIDLKTADKSYYVKFYLVGGPAQQIGQFLAARHQFDSGGDQPVEYLDVRVQGKIFYK